MMQVCALFSGKIFLRKVKRKYILKEMEPLNTTSMERNRAEFTSTHHSLLRFLVWSFFEM